MFSGIVETTAPILSFGERPGIAECEIERPAHFDDLQIGDSIAVDGVCLTLEKMDERGLKFALGAETLKVTGWAGDNVIGRLVNLERSLRLNDRIHGHLVTGHVDATTTVKSAERHGEGLRLTFQLPEPLKPFIWSKGSVAINGVSLTINDVGPDYFQVGLIPETLKRTNLGILREGSQVNLEIDNVARGLVHQVRNRES